MSTEGLRQRIARVGAYALLSALLACGPESEADVEAPPANVDTGPQTRISAGGSRSFVSYSHSCAIVDGGVQCWGANGNGQLGDGFVTLRVPLPSRVPALDHGVTAIAAGGAHTCAIRSGGVLCWGRNDRRQIAAVRPAVIPEPAEIPGLPEPVSRIAAGDDHTCAVSRGELYCWGRGTEGELGMPLSERCGGYRAKDTCSTTPLRVAGIPGTVTDVALGDHHTCAIADAQIYCWGRNDRGQLGVPPSRTAPAGISQRPLKIEHSGPATAISAGVAHSCALIAARVFCWGAGDDGQLGNGTRSDRHSPEPVTGLEMESTQVSVGARHSCSISAGRVYCWGSNSDGQLGAEGPDRDTPIAIAGLVDGVTDLASGADHSCAVRESGTVSCWGANDFGQLGNGKPSRSAPPLNVAEWERGGIRDRNGDGRITIVCLGDSNTQRGYLYDRTWCERLESLLRESAKSHSPTGSPSALATWETINRGWSGATAISLPSMRRAEEQLAYTLEFDRPDVLILSYGTNDLLQEATPEDVLLASVRLLLRAREAGVDTFVALVPSAFDQGAAFDAGVKATNELIRRAVRADRVIDFASVSSADDYHDEVHLNAAGHEKRASAALAALCPTACTER